MSYKTVFLKSERRSIAILASIFSLRMLGLFMILPVFAIYAEDLEGATPTLIGVALGIYGLLQAILQTPLGYISDRLGRKPVIVLGLLIFAIGSVVAAMSQSITGVILGRSIQGAGAIGSVIMALLSDLTREEVRLKAMAIIGISIGASFGLAFVLGPIIAVWVGVPGIFGLIAVLSLSAILVLYWGLPTSVSVPAEITPSYQESMSNLKSMSVTTSSSVHGPMPLTASFSSVKQTVFLSAEIIPVYFGVFVIHACLTALFLKLPLALTSFMPTADQALQFYLPIFLVSVLFTFSFLSFLDKKDTRKYHQSLLPVLLVLLISLLTLFTSMHFISKRDALTSIQSFWQSWFGLGLGLTLFLTAFNLLEASLPSHLSRKVPKEHKGMALGVFSSLQFLGLCLGGVLGGWLDAQFGSLAVFLFCVILTLSWSVWIVWLNYKSVFN